MQRKSSFEFERISSNNDLTQVRFQSLDILPTQKNTDNWVSSVLFRITQGMVIFYRCITPFSYSYLLALLYFVPFHDLFDFHKNPFTFLLTTSMCAEALFFPYYIYLLTHLNNMNDGLKHLATNRKTRMMLVKQCVQALYIAGLNYGEKYPHPELYIRSVIQRWFFNCPLESINYENMFSWSAWAFFGKDENHLTLDEVAENHDIVGYIEKTIHHSFPKERSKIVTSIRLNLDPLLASQRPFFFYVVVGIMNLTTHAALLILLNFHMLPEYSTKNQSQKIYYRQGSTPKSKSLPIVFVHGIGIGFTQYFALLYNFPYDVDVYLVEWPHVAMQMMPEGPIPEESITSLMRVLRDHGHTKACFVAHSLGTVLVSWMLHDSIASAMVASTVLLDPIIFLLFDPTVATVFLYKNPENILDLLMHYFVSRELFISNALYRHFTWSYNVLFVEDLYNNKKCCQALHSHLILDLLGNTSNPDPKHSQGFDDLTENFISEEQQTHCLDYFEAPLGEGKHWLNHMHKHQDIDHTFIFSKDDFIVPVESVINYLKGKARKGFASFEVLEFPGTHGEMLLRPALIQVINKKIEDRYSNRLD